MSSSRDGPRLLHDVIGYGTEQAFRIALTAVIGVFVARLLGPSDLGLLAFAGSVYGLLVPFVLLGMPSILVREFSTTADWRPAMAASLAMQLPVGLVAGVLGFLVVTGARGFDPHAVGVALVMSPIPLFALSQSLRSYLESKRKVGRIVATGLVATLLASAWRIAGLVLEGPVWFFAAAATLEAAALLVGLLSGIPETVSLRSVRISFEREVARRLLDEGWPLLLAAVAVTVYMKADLLMLGVLAGDDETGIYAAAARLSEVGYFIPVAVAAAVRPRLARLFSERKQAAYDWTTQRFITGLAAVAFLLVAAVLWLADSLVLMLYGAEFSPAIPVLQLHVMAAPFVFIGVGGGQWFVDRGLTRLVMHRSVAGALINVLLNLILIPHHGAMGAAIATLVAYASGVALNAFHRSTRSLFRMQASAMRLHWPAPPSDDASND